MAQPKKSSKIIITTSDSIELAEKTIVGLLLQDGYGIHFIDKDYHIITTTPNGYKYGTISLNISMIETDSTRITISGMDKNDDLNSAINILYRGMKGSPVRIAWEEMYGLAEQYKNGRLGYE